jgi:hypothetical protein
MQPIPSKNPGDEYTSEEFNSSNNELKNTVSNASITLSGSDDNQITKAMVNYVGSADYYIDSGSANVYTLDPDSPKPAPTELFKGLRCRFLPSNSNTGASTVNVASLGVKSIKKYGTDRDVEEGDIVANALVEIVYVHGADVFELVSIENPIVRESIPLFLKRFGMALSNNAGTPLSKVDIAAGSIKATANDSAATLQTALTKDLSVNWAEGNNQGGKASGVPLVADQTYYVFAIFKEGGTVDAGFDTDSAAGNLLADAGPSGYIHYRYIGSVLTETGSTDVVQFIQVGNTFLKKDPQSKNFNNPGTTAFLSAFQVPLGRRVNGLFSGLIINTDVAFAVSAAGYNPDLNDPASSHTFGIMGSAVQNEDSAQFEIITDTSQQIKLKYFYSGGSVQSDIALYGYEDFLEEEA